VGWAKRSLVHLKHRPTGGYPRMGRARMKITIAPAEIGQFGGAGNTFCLVTTEARIDDFVLAPDGAYRNLLTLPLPTGADLADLLADQVPQDADVLVVCPDRFLASPSQEAIAGRRLAVIPAGSTPLTWEQVRYFLQVAERNDVVQQGKVADTFFESAERASELRITDASHGTAAVFEHRAGDYSWNQQAGPLGAGEQQILPAGELSVLPVDITGFDPDARLAISGSLTLRGWPIVHRYDVPDDLVDQHRLFTVLRDLVTHPVILHVVDGVIERHEATDAGGNCVAATLQDLFDADPRYRTIWELGFGINTDLDVLPGNCGPNEVYGAIDGAFHLGLGLTPTTRFALTFSCPGSSLTTPAGQVVLGAGPRGTRTGTLRRTSSASCGCH